MSTTSVILIMLVAALAVVAWQVGRLRSALGQREPEFGDVLGLLQREVESIRHGVDERLREHVGQAQELAGRLGQMQKATEEIERFGRKLGELERIFGTPRLRGALGERFLEELLADVLPRDRFRVQYTYPVTGTRVDVAVMLENGRILPIDSKFPLENFRRYVELERSGHPGSRSARRAFSRDMRRHVDAIAERYLSPADGAIDLALMYVPSEAVFQHIASWQVEGDGRSLAEYALGRRVVAVSPSTLHAYLCVLRTALRGLELQEGAGAVLRMLTDLQHGLESAGSDLSLAMSQARHSLNNMKKVEDVLRRMGEHLATVEHKGSPA